MSRSPFVIGAALLLAGGLNLLFAQHGAGHGSSGHASSASHGSSFSSGYARSAPASTTFSTLSNHYPLPGQAVYPTPIGLQRQYSGYTGINRGALPIGGGRAGRRYGNGYGFRGGYFYPYYLSTFDDSDYSPYAYNNYAGSDPSAQTSNVTANLLGEQIAQLSAEVDALRNAGGAQYDQPETRIPYRAPPASAEDESAPEPPLTLILANGRKLQLKNYAVMGQDVWDFSTQPARRIALSTVDIAASKAASEASGAEFPEIH
jgi:hypothetical protein